MIEPTRIFFREDCIPPRTSHHRKKIITIRPRNKPAFHRLGDMESLEIAKSFWDSLFLPWRPQQPFTNAIRLWIELEWPWNSTDSKKARLLGRILHQTAPDCSNMLKTIEDALGRCGFFTNDSLVCDVRCRKFRGDRPGIVVLIEPIEISGVADFTFITPSPKETLALDAMISGARK